MKKTGIILIIMLGIILVPDLVYASPGRTDANGCHTCRTNCAEYGLNDGDYHCHNSGSTNSDSSNNSVAEENSNNDLSNNDNSANNAINNDTSTNNDNSSDNNSNNSATNDSSTNSQNSTNTSSNTINSEETKSSDNTLKTLTIDGEDIEISDNIVYTTTKEGVDIDVTTNDDKAKFEIKNNSELELGDNKVTIEVTAEDGTLKTYVVNIIREKVLSSDVGIKVFIDGEEVKFSDYKASVDVSGSTNNVKVDYTLSDKNATAQMNNINELKDGDNTLKIKVIAEDGTEQDYEVIIHKASNKVEDIIATVFALGIIGGFGYGIYYVIKKCISKIKK